MTTQVKKKVDCKNLSGLDLSSLTREERERVERALKPPRDEVFSLRFAHANIAAWREAAEDADESLTDWVQSALDKKAGVK